MKERGITAMCFDKAVVSTPETGVSLETPGRRYIVHATAAQTAGALGIWELILEPGRGIHIHTHTREDEVFRVLEGRFRFWCGDQTVEGGKGFTIALPRHVRHGFHNTGETQGHLLGFVTPGGFEQIFFDLEQLGTSPFEGQLTELNRKYGLVGHGPPPEQESD
jgi:mannose-6-phosphate isomerase-like protein (cupin superfamily)